MDRLQCRPIAAGDETFLRAVYAATREQEIAQTGWDAATAQAFLRQQFDAQHAHYLRHNPEADFDLVLHDGAAVGRLYVRRDADRVHVIDIAILPQFRNRGIGSALLGALIREAQHGGKRVTIHVELDNRAFSLYRRLGFEEVSVGGFHRLMQWVPGKPAATP